MKHMLVTAHRCFLCRLYQIALDGKLPAVPTLLLDSTALLRPCEHSTHVACTQVDEFHPYHDDTGDGSGYIAFAYRAWNSIGFPAGSQVHTTAFHCSLTPCTL